MISQRLLFTLRDRLNAPDGFEPSTFPLIWGCSGHLSYNATMFVAEDEGIEPSTLRLAGISSPVCALHAILLNCIFDAVVTT